jgi:hypothetical protein
MTQNAQESSATQAVMEQQSLVSSNAAAGAAAQAAQTKSVKPRHDPNEVGWQFVQEYYTILNKDPSKLHRFYSADSAMLHGLEGEPVDSSKGQHEIHVKFKELKLKDSKVVVSNVDSQSSLSGGILVSVLGEHELKGKTPRKFSQVFFLAEQPNGFYVLNDVFRYLKQEDDVEEEYQGSSGTGAAVSSASDFDANGKDVEHVEKLVEVPVLMEKNGVVEPVVAERVEEKKEVPPKKEQQQVQPSKEKEKPTQKQTHQPKHQEKPSSVSQTVSKPQKEEPSGPKTWASLAAKDAPKTVSVVESKSSSPQPTVAAPAPQHAAPASQPEHQDKKKQVAAANGTHTAAAPSSASQHQQSQFVRNSFHISGFTKLTKIQQIKEALTQALGVHPEWVDLITEVILFGFN